MIDGVQMSAYSVTSARVPIKPIRFGNEGVDALLSRKQFHSFLKLDLHASGSLAATKAFLATGLCGLCWYRGSEYYRLCMCDKYGTHDRPRPRLYSLVRSSTTYAIWATYRYILILKILSFTLVE